jgi:hypothetical protein
MSRETWRLGLDRQGSQVVRSIGMIVLWDWRTTMQMYAQFSCGQQMKLYFFGLLCEQGRCVQITASSNDRPINDAAASNADNFIKSCQSDACPATEGMLVKEILAPKPCARVMQPGCLTWSFRPTIQASQVSCRLHGAHRTSPISTLPCSARQTDVTVDDISSCRLHFPSTTSRPLDGQLSEDRMEENRLPALPQWHRYETSSLPPS